MYLSEKLFRGAYCCTEKVLRVVLINRLVSHPVKTQYIFQNNGNCACHYDSFFSLLIGHNTADAPDKKLWKLKLIKLQVRQLD